jgi:hypothetical protein
MQLVPHCRRAALSTPGTRFAADLSRISFESKSREQFVGRSRAPLSQLQLEL